jgi:ATP-dependent DNA ligase
MLPKFTTTKRYATETTKIAVEPKPPTQVNIDPNRVCQLAETIEKVTFGQEYLIEPKLDGVRVITVVNNAQSFKMISRNGNSYASFHSSFKSDIERIYLRIQEIDQNVSGIVLDGEMVTTDNRFTTVAGLSHTKAVKLGILNNLRYHIFDVLHLNDYLELGKRCTQIERKKLLESTLSTQFFAVNPDTLCRIVGYQKVVLNNMTEVSNLVAAFVRAGYEGIMLKEPTAVYMRSRNKAILKAKQFNTYDLKLIGFTPGEGQNKNILGALVLESANGKTVKVGSGFSSKQRKEIWDNQKSFEGKIVEVTAQEVSKNSLRFPVFVKFRGDKQLPDKF